jgi:hypothetical protein
MCDDKLDGSYKRRISINRHLTVFLLAPVGPYKSDRDASKQDKRASTYSSGGNEPIHPFTAFRNALPMRVPWARLRSTLQAKGHLRFFKEVLIYLLEDE